MNNSLQEVKEALAIVDAANSVMSLRRTLEALEPEARADALEERLKKMPLTGDGAKLAKEYRKALGDLLSRQAIRLSIDRAIMARDGRHDPDAEEDPITVFEAAMDEGGLILETGIDKIDMAFGGGIRPRECLSIVAAEGSGKTSFLLGMLDRYSRAGGRCLHFNLDMADAKFVEKHLAMLMRTLPRKVDEERRANADRYKDAVNEIRSRSNFKVIHGPRTLSQMDREMLEFKPKVVSIDYITAIEGDFKNDYDTVKGAIRCLRRWRDEWGTSFVLLSQMGRGSKSDVSKGGVGSHALGGGDIERFVDYEIELIQDPKPEAPKEKRYIATITKNRGGTSRQSFELDFKVDGLYFGRVSWKVELDTTPRILFKSSNGFSLKEQAAKEKQEADAAKARDREEREAKQEERRKEREAEQERKRADAEARKAEREAKKTKSADTPKRVKTVTPEVLSWYREQPEERRADLEEKARAEWSPIMARTEEDAVQASIVAEYNRAHERPVERIAFPGAMVGKSSPLGVTSFDPLADVRSEVEDEGAVILDLEEDASRKERLKKELLSDDED